MDAAVQGSPVAAIPMRLDRRLRLGPFPRAQDAIKFVCYGAAGAVFVPFLGAVGVVPFLAAGFLFSAWRPDGESLDERALRYVAWRARRHRRGPSVTPRTGRGGAHRYLRAADGTPVVVLRSGGTPVAYRPPAELERLFRAWGDFLRALDGSVYLRAGTAPLAAAPFRPRPAEAAEEDATARAGYDELVAVLCRRRLVRRVDVALAAAEATPEASARLETRARMAAERLAALGVRPTRLTGTALADAGHRFGWEAEAAP
jgi:hypothetical protein